LVKISKFGAILLEAYWKVELKEAPKTRPPSLPVPTLEGEEECDTG